MKIILADQSQESRQSFIKALQHLNLPITVLGAQAMEELYDCLNETPGVDLIFLDIAGIADGEKCLSLLKSSKQFKHIPVIVYTMSTYAHHIENAFVNGAHAYVIKPYVQVNLELTLKKVLHTNWSEINLTSRDHFVIDLLFNE